MKSILITALTTMCFAIVTMSQTLPAYIPANGLVGWWPFNGNANDESGNNNIGTVNGSTLTTDRFGNQNCAYSFDGVDDYISVTNNATLNFESVNSFTFGYWFNANSLSSTQLSLILSKQSGLGLSQDGFNSNIESNRSSNFRIKNGTSTPSFEIGTAVNSVGINTWIHVVQIWSGNIGKIYLNGILAASNTGIAVVGNNTSNLFIGKPNWVAANVKNFHGKIDDIGIWNRALTLCEIQDLFNAQVNSSTGISAGVDQTVCAGQSVTLSGSGASSYTWDNGITNGSSFTPFSTTMYTVTGTNASGCVVTDQVLVTVNPLPTIDPGFDLVVCEGEQITLTCTGAETYFWDNNVTNGVPFTPTHLGDEIFSVIATDLNGCSANGSVLVSVNENTSSTQTQVACSSFTLNNQTFTQSGVYTQLLSNSQGCDSTITLNLTITQPTSSTITQTTCSTFTLNNQTYNQSGVYTQQLTNVQGCDSTITLNLTILPLPSVAVTSSSGVLTANQQNATYQWLDCDNNYNPISGATFNSFTPQISGNYAVEINQNSCIDTSQCYAVTVNSSGLSEYLISNDRLFPNPNNGSFYFESDKGGNYIITDGIGKVIYSFSIEKSNKKLVTITNLPNGVYFIVPEGSNSLPLKLVID